MTLFPVKAAHYWQKQRLRTKLGTAFLLITLVPFFILALAIHFIGHRFVSTIVMERNQFLAEHIGVHLEQMLGEKINTLKFTAASPAMQSLGTPVQTEILASMVRLDPDLLIVVMSDRNGRQVARSDAQKPDPNINYSDRSYYKTALATKQTAFSETQASRSTGILSIAVAQPILDKQLEIRGLIIAVIDLQKIIDLTRKYEFTPNSFAFLVNADGEILYHPGRNIGENLSGLLPIQKMQVTKDGAVFYELDGKEFVGGYRRISQPGWFLVVRQPLDEALADMDWLRNVLVFLFLFTVLLSILTGIRIARSISQPITDMAVMAERLAGSNLNASIWVHDTEELQTLAASFNNMAVQIQKREADLKQSEARYRSMVEHLNIGVYRRLNESGAFLEYANPALVKILGCSSMEELFSTDFSHFLMKQESFRNYLELLHMETHVRDRELKIQRRDGVEVWCSCTANRHFDPETGLTWIDAAVEDVTERKLAGERLQQAYDSLEIKVRERTHELEELNEKLRSISLLDGLTGIANRRYFDEFLFREWQRAKREQSPISMLLLDVDHFKLYNDAYGHIAGDECLKQVAATLKSITKRATDLAARYGGEEFALILPGTPQQNAMALAYKLLSSMEELHLEHKASPVRPYVTVSIGCATVVPERFSDPDTILLAADQTLYLAKQNGRNQVQCHLRPL